MRRATSIANSSLPIHARPPSRRIKLPRRLAFGALIALALSLPLASLTQTSVIRATPTASGAEPPYPLNHTLDPSIQAVGTPPLGNSLETDPFTVGTPPTNNGLTEPSTQVGTPPGNSDFESGGLTPWTTNGTVTVQTASGQGNFARFDSSGASVTSDAFTVDAAAQHLVFDVGFLSTSGNSWVRTYVLSGTDFGTSTEVGSYQCGSCGTWVTKYVDVSAYRGQSVKVRFVRGTGSQVSGVDVVRMEVVFPGWDTTGTISRRTETGENAFISLEGGTSPAITSPAFTIDSSAQFMATKVRGLSGGTDSYSIDVLTGPDFSTRTEVAFGNAEDADWQTIRWNVQQWQGQIIKVRVKRSWNKIGVDDIGVAYVAVQHWDVTKDTRHESGGPTGDYVTTNGNLTSQPFTIEPGAQHLTLRAKDPGSTSIFYVELLRGPTFSTVTNLGGGPEYPTSEWKTYKYGVDIYAGETVRLRIRQYWARGAFDDIGLMESALPGWTLTSDAAVATGTDSYGTYVSGYDGSTYIQSSLISPGIVDTGGAQLKFYALTYQHMGAQNATVRVSWRNTSGGDWVVSTQMSNTADGLKTAYFYVADFMGSTGYFRVQVTSTSRFYSIADNIARQQLQEPMSHKAGIGIDTSTGGFGFSDPDIQLGGRMPLNFRRFYTGHSDRLGPLGYRWSHSYDTRLTFAGADDVGVIFGSGGEEFFNGNSSWVFAPADPRIIDELVRNSDGTFTFKTKLTFTYSYDAEGNPTGITEVGGTSATTSLDASGRLDGIGGTARLTVNRSYNFNAAGILTSIVDLNGNTITLAYDGNGRLSTVSDPDGRFLALAYNASGQLTSVTAPGNAVVTYTYDADGDLIEVTDPEGGVRVYAYDSHRIVSATDQEGDPLFINTTDAVGRVIAQTDAAANGITIGYDTPAKGVTSVTDQVGQTARYYFDVHHRTTDKVDPLSRVLSYVYDTNGRLQKVIDPANNQWQFAYDASGGLTNLVDPLGNAMAMTYGAQHLPTTITDGRGYTTTMTYDSQGNLLTVTDPLGKTTTMTYDVAGKMLTRTNPLGQTETFTYDSSGNVATRTDPLGHTWSWTYDGSGRMLSETNPLGQTKTWSYLFGGQIAIETDELGGTKYLGYTADGRIRIMDDELGHRTEWFYDDRGLVSAKLDPAGHLTAYDYDANRRLVAVTDPNGLTSEYEYDDAGHIIALIDPLGARTSYEYDAPGRLIAMTDALGRETSYTYDDAGRWLSTVMPNGGAYTNAYDANGNFIVETDPLGRSFTYLYDALNRRVRETDPELAQTNFTFDDAGRLTIREDALGQQTTFVYDARGLLTTRTSPLGAVTAFGYDAAGRQTSITEALGRTTTYTHDAAGRTVSTTDNTGNATAFGYDAAGRQTSKTLPTGSQTAYAYDPRGLLLSVTDAVGGITSNSYDPGGRLVATTDARGNVTTIGFDGAGRQTSMTDALGGVVSFTYNVAGELVSRTNPAGATTTFTYNPLGLPTSETDSLGNTRARTYDAAGQLVTFTDARGTTQTFTYDGAGRLTNIAYPGGAVSRTYDALGRRTSMTDATGTTSWTYDAMSRVTSVAAPGGAVSYTYNAAGDRVSMTLPGSKTLTYAYDSAGRLGTLTDWNSQVTSFSYNSNGWRTAISRPNGVTSTFGYDGAGRATSIVHSTTGGPLLAFSYTYDANGNRTAETANGTTEAFTFDAVNRLASVSHGGGGSTAYSYDPSGNRLTKTADGVTTTYSYTAHGERLLADGTVAYSYDADGNLTARGSDTFAYDYAGRMTSATVTGVTSTFAYDGDDVRTSVSTGSTTLPQVWDRLCMAGTCGACGGAGQTVPRMVDDTQAAYVWAEGLVAEVSSANGRVDTMTDALGSVRGWTDAAATTVATADYDAFGSVASSTGVPGQFRFTGEEWDATGLEYLRARYYDPATGRFTAADTVQPNAPGTQGWNLYAYVANNPTTWTDPTGHVAAGAIPRAPTAGGATDSLAPYVVAAVAAGSLAGLGLKIRDALTYLGLVLSGAWVLADIWQAVTEDGDSSACDAKMEQLLDRCSAWAKGRGRQFACCRAIASQGWSNCLGGKKYWPPMPWDDPDGELCVKGIYLEG